MLGHYNKANCYNADCIFCVIVETPVILHWDSCLVLLRWYPDLFIEVVFACLACVLYFFMYFVFGLLHTQRFMNWFFLLLHKNIYD